MFLATGRDLAPWAFFGFLLAAEIAVPPARLPSADEQHDEDRLAFRNVTFVDFVWGLDNALAQVSCAGAFAVFLWLAVTVFFEFVVFRLFPGLPRERGPREEGAEERRRRSLWTTLGILMSVAGFGLRLWSKVVLGRHFKYRIAPPDGELVTFGPYGVLIHPGYAGSLIHLAGVCVLGALCLKRPHGGLSIAVIVALVAASTSLIHVRIHDEEAMLLGHFGEDKWMAHANARWRLVPYVY